MFGETLRALFLPIKLRLFYVNGPTEQLSEPPTVLAEAVYLANRLSALNEKETSLVRQRYTPDSLATSDPGLKEHIHQTALPNHVTHDQCPVGETSEDIMLWKRPQGLK